MLCAVCQKKAETTCSSCKCTYYCSRECQKLDWKVHKKFCKSFVIKEVEEEKNGLNFTRRSIVAAKNLVLGDYILEEMPLFQIARLPCTFYNQEVSKKRNKEHHYYCSTCGDKKSVKRCDRCNWPVCVDARKNCGKHKLHAENECEILASKKIDYDSLDAFEDRRVLLIIRAQAVKEKKPEVWNELMKRADEISKNGQNSVFNREEISKLEQAMKKLKISKEDMEIYKKFFRLLNLTSIFYSSYGEFDSHMGLQDGRMGDFLYPLSNYLSNSCAPNCSYAIDSQPNFKIQVRAARDIKKGEELTISIDQLIFPLFEGTTERRLMIKERFGYLCKCERCSDPTEFGTFFSGIICQDCRPGGENKNQLEENVGYFLPVDPESKLEEEKEYSPLVQCNKCETTRPYSSFKELLSAEKQFEIKIPTSMKMPTTQEIHVAHERVKLLLAKYSGKSLHPNHFIIHKGHMLFIIHKGHMLFSENFNTVEPNSSEEKIKSLENWKDVFHYSKIQEALETKLLHGSLMFNQVRLQDITASGLTGFARTQAFTEDCPIPEDELIDAMEKIKESIQLLTGAIHFHTKQMPTFCKRKFELATIIQELQRDKNLLQQLNLIHDSLSDLKAKQKRRNF